jgi:hypothetical protein
MMRKLTLALSTAVLALSGAAIAQTASGQTRAPRPDMTRADAQARAEAAFARMDANKDGTLDQADRAARKAQMFDRIDADRNGSISRAEFDAMHASRGGMGEGRGHGMAGEHGMMAGDHAKMGGMMGGKMAGTMGADAAPVTRQAFVGRALSRFDQADANRDGTVTQAERKAMHDTMRQTARPAREQG